MRGITFYANRLASGVPRTRVTDEQSVERYNQALLTWLKESVPQQCRTAGDLVAFVESDPSIKRAEALAQHEGFRCDGRSAPVQRVH